jgi:class I fructose-bisphosphate aldolase
VEDAISAGAQGVVVGRKVWQRPPEEASEVIGEMARITREKYTRRW